MWPDHPASSFSLISTSRCPRPPPVPPAPLGLRSWHPRERGSPWMWCARLGQEPEGCPGAHLMGFWRDPALSAAAGGRVRGRLFRRLVSSCTTLSIFLRLGSCHNYNVLFISSQTLLFCGNDSEPHWSILRLSWWTLQTRCLHGVCWLTPWILWGLLRPLHQTSVAGDVTRMSLGIWNNISPVPTTGPLWGPSARRAAILSQQHSTSHRPPGLRKDMFLTAEILHRLFRWKHVTARHSCVQDSMRFELHILFYFCIKQDI